MPSLALVSECGPDLLRIIEAGFQDRNNVISLRKPNSAAAEAYRTLRASILLSPPELKTLMVTSSVPGKGKTSVTANRAVVLAQQRKRVLLVD